MRSPLKNPNCYRVFGLKIKSSVPLFEECPFRGDPDVTISWGGVPDSLRNPTVQGVRYQAGPGEFLLQIDRVARYFVSSGDSIIVQRYPGASVEDIRLFLMGSAMGALLHQRNLLPLHASAINCEGEGVLFLGESGAGKSTLGAAFQNRGYSLLADDVCAVTTDPGGGSRVVPGFPRLKVWADTLEWLNEGKGQLDRVRLEPEFEKYFLPFAKAEDGPLPIRAGFILQSHDQGIFEIEELGASEKMESLIQHTYRPQLLEGLGRKVSHFKQCAALATGIRVLRVTRPNKGFLLEELMALVERHW